MSLPEKILQLAQAAKEKEKLWDAANKEILLVEEAFEKLHVERDVWVLMESQIEAIGWTNKNETKKRRLVYGNDQKFSLLINAPLPIRLRARDFLPKIVDKVIETTNIVDLHTV